MSELQELRKRRACLLQEELHSERFDKSVFKDIDAKIKALESAPAPKPKREPVRIFHARFNGQMVTFSNQAEQLAWAGEFLKNKKAGA